MRYARLLRFSLLLAGLGAPCAALVGTSTTCGAPASASFGDPVNVIITVSAVSGGVPTGGVAVSDGSNVIGSASLDSNGTAKISAAFGLGSHVITCSYAGDSGFGASMSTAALTVAPAAPKIFIEPSQNPVPAGERVTIAVRLVGAGGAPSGSITLLDGGTVLAVLPLSQNQDDSVAQFTTNALAAGSHTLSVAYDGDAMFSATTSQPFLLVIGRRSTTTSIFSTTSGSNGQPTAVAIQVSGDSGTPTGSVTLTEGSGAKPTILGSAKLNAGSATSLSLGTHTVVANYSGDDTFAASTSAPAVLTGFAAVTNLMLAGTPNPSQVGQVVTLTASLTSSGGTPAGTITFQNSQGVAGTATLNSAGQATFTASFASSGTYVFTANFAGNAQFSPSTSVALALFVDPKRLAIVSAASGTNPVAPDSLVSIYGDQLAAGPVSAALLPWPPVLGGSSVVFRDSAGVDRLAALKFVSPGQINAVVPPDLPVGTATVIARNNGVDGMGGTVTIANTAPGVFSGDGSGRGGAAAYVQLYRANGSVVFQVTFGCVSNNQCSTQPIDLGGDGDVAVLTLFATGLRRAAPGSVRVLVGGQALTPSYAGPQSQIGGVDQVNVTIPAVLRGAGEVPVTIVIGDQVSNTVTVRFR